MGASRIDPGVGQPGRSYDPDEAIFGVLNPTFLSQCTVTQEYIIRNAMELYFFIFIIKQTGIVKFAGFLHI